MSGHRPAPLPDPSPDDALLSEQAADWLVQLTDDDLRARAQARQGYEAWKAADPRRAEIAAEMERFLGHVRTTRRATAGEPRAAHAALDASLAVTRKKGRAKRTATGLVATLLLAACGWLALQTWPPGYLLADLNTATGEWQSHTLADGTQITLNSHSAVNMRYDATRRVLELVQGEILVDVARDATRPFIVETAHGSIRALGTRFVVRREADATILSMLQSRVAVQTARHRSSEPDTIVEAGQRVVITANGISAPEAFEPIDVSAGWQHRQLMVSDQPLPDVLDELARQRRGHIRYNRADIGHIRVSAVLPLHDTTQALQLLKNKFPQLRIRTLTPLLVMVDAPGAAFD